MLVSFWTSAGAHFASFELGQWFPMHSLLLLCSCIFPALTQNFLHRKIEWEFLTFARMTVNSATFSFTKNQGSSMQLLAFYLGVLFLKYPPHRMPASSGILWYSCVNILLSDRQPPPSCFNIIKERKIRGAAISPHFIRSVSMSGRLAGSGLLLPLMVKLSQMCHCCRL